MKIKTIVLFSLLVAQIQSQNLVLGSWNIKDFGNSRDSDEIEMIAELLRNFDIVAIQEVVAKDPGGVKAVARLVNELDRKGTDWDYVVSDPTESTSGNKSERYAYIWKKDKLKLIGKPRLLSELSQRVEREPFYAKFKFNNKSFEVLNYHACTHDTHYPERIEIRIISNWLMENCSDNIILCGDMNLEIIDRVFDSLFASGFLNLLNGEFTSLKMKCNNGDFLSSSEDNILFKLSNISVVSRSIINFIDPNNCEEVIWKRNSFSDHLPIKMVLN